MDILLEFLLELVVEGSLELGTSRRVPKPVRIAALLVFAVFWCAVIGLLIFTGVLLTKSVGILPGLPLFLIAALCVWKTISAFRKKLRGK